MGLLSDQLDKSVHDMRCRLMATMAINNDGHDDLFTSYPNPLNSQAVFALDGPMV